MNEINDSLECKLPPILRQSLFSYQESLDAYWQQEWEVLATLPVADLNLLNTEENSRHLPVLFTQDRQISTAQPIPWSKWERALAAGFVGSILLHTAILNLQLPVPKAPKIEKHDALIMTQLAPKPKRIQPPFPEPQLRKAIKTEVAQAPKKAYASRPIMSSKSDKVTGPEISANMVTGSRGTGLGTDKGIDDGNDPKGDPGGNANAPIANTPAIPASLPPQPPVVTTKPLLRSDINPIYPEIAKQNSWEGRVVVFAHISETGAVESAEVVRSSGHPELDEAALAAVKASRFEPAHRGPATHSRHSPHPHQLCVGIAMANQ